MKFTIIIATCDRPDRLVKALECVAAAVQAHGETDEVIVVDNGCDRLANEVVESFSSGSNVAVKYSVSPPRNKAAALNAGIAAAAADWIGFTDDDALPGKDWLVEAERYACSTSVNVFGGKVEPGEREKDYPIWMKPDGTITIPAGPATVRYEPMTESGMLGDTTVPFGANIFFKKSIAARYGGYDEALWKRCGSAALGSEDAEFAMRLRERSEPIGYCAECVVVHPVYADRMTLRVYLKHAYTHGVRETLLFDSDTGVRMKLYLLKTAVFAGLASLGRSILFRPEYAVQNLMKAVFAVGQLAGMRKHR